MPIVKTYAFGPFLLVPDQQLLLRGLQPVLMGGRAFELLTLLVERAGEVVSKQDLMSRVWPTTVVVEGNIKVNMWCVRQALGQVRGNPPGVTPYITTVPGRGYRFTAPVQASILPQAPHPPVCVVTPLGGIGFWGMADARRVNPGEIRLR